MVADPTPRRDFLPRFGIALTTVYIILLISYTVCCWRNILAMTPDEFGSAIGGASGPIAFLWLVLGFFQQGRELRISSDALRLQGEELRHSVEQQRQLVAVQREQINAEREALEEQKSEERRRAQPTFRLIADGTTSNGLETLYHFSLVNVGATCTDLMVLNDLFPLQQRDEFRSGERIALTYSLSQKQSLEPLDGAVEFRDALGRRGMQTFLIPVVEIQGQSAFTEASFKDDKGGSI